MLGLPPTITVIKDVDDAAAVTSISAPLITRTAATPQDSPKDVDFDRINNAAAATERCPSLQLPYGCAVFIIIIAFLMFYHNS